MAGIETILNDVGHLLVSELAIDLVKKKKVASSKLINSLKFETALTPTGFDINILGLDYGKWVNVGRKKGAKKVPIKALVEWITQRALETGDKKKLNRAFAIQMAIWKNGIKPTHFIEDTIKKVNNKMFDMLSDAASLQVSNNVDKLIKEHGFNN